MIVAAAGLVIAIVFEAVVMDDEQIDGDPSNKVRVMNNVATFYFVCDVMCKIWQIFEIRVMRKIKLSRWHISTAIYDVVLLASASFAGLIVDSSSQDVGVVL